MEGHLNYKFSGVLIIIQILLYEQEDEETSEYALDGLKQVMAVKSRVVLPYLVPQVIAFHLLSQLSVLVAQHLAVAIIDIWHCFSYEVNDIEMLWLKTQRKLHSQFVNNCQHSHSNVLINRQGKCSIMPL